MCRRTGRADNHKFMANEASIRDTNWAGAAGQKLISTSRAQLVGTKLRGSGPLSQRDQQFRQALFLGYEGHVFFGAITRAGAMRPNGSSCCPYIVNFL